MNSRFALVFIVCLLGSTCDPGGKPEAAAHGRSGAPQDPGPAAGADAAPAPARARSQKSMEVHQNLTALLHLADYYDRDVRTLERLPVTACVFRSMITVQPSHTVS